MDLQQRVLKETFGYSSFRPGQKRLIDAILSGRDVLGVLPTGAGKSLCYQLPSCLLHGITLVLSPLISLMDDQVSALHALGMTAACLHSGMPSSNYAAAVKNISSGRCKLIYAAPERLENEQFLALMRSLPLSLLVVDEAHCISQWGHDFRPSYRRIPQLISILSPRPVVAAFTATATAQVRQDISDCLQLQNPERVVTSFDRPNLYFDVVRPVDKDAALLRFLQRQKQFPGIVYCATRKAAEHTSALLQENHIPAAAYHAGLNPEQRSTVQHAFVHDKISVLCATNAFGMGIDKSNVRFVVHYQMPANLENYYQEAGRAGRDGAAANCLLLFSESDLALQEYMITKEPDNLTMSDEQVADLRRKRILQLHTMQRYALSDSCLRQQILTYFGEQTSDFCGCCCNCDAESEIRDVTIEAQKILSCIYRAGQKADANTIIRILQGKSTPMIAQYGWSKLSTFGLMPDSSEDELSALISHLLHRHYVIKTESDDGSKLCLCAAAKEVLFHGQTVSMKTRTSSVSTIRERRAVNHSINPELFRKLLELRRSFAARQGLPPASLLTDSALEEICVLRPQTESQLFAINGINQHKLKRYSTQILKIVAQKE